ncbi:MAG: RNA-directed DNA polymerase [Bacteroidales bacterium]|nr:RNA-directed DNA polymerase [Bacteroidales bacterium]
MKTILEVSEVKAHRYFMEPENYCSLDIPRYINFKPILDYVEKKIGNKQLEEILKDINVKPSEYDDVNHKLLVKKDAKYTFRPIQIINPYLYYLMVKLITRSDNWKEIKKRFKVFQQPQIEVTSLPVIKDKKSKSHRAAGISIWWENIEQRSIVLSMQYKYMFVTDITNCYGSIYTHSIAWALMGKEEAKKKRNIHGLLGNSIDIHIRNMQYGQTNGIPQGSSLFDFIAELVLGYADLMLSERLKQERITEYKILRHRDDYRIFGNSKEELERIAFILQDVLAELNFQLNTKKTLMTEDVIQNSIKPDKIAYFANNPLYKISGSRVTTIASSFQQEALYMHQFARVFPNSGRLVKMLNIFSKRLTKSKKAINEVDVEVLIAILTEIAKGSPKVYNLVLQIISVLVVKFPTTDKRETIVRNIYNNFLTIPNIGELEIWMQHITFKLPNPIPYSEPLCKIVSNEQSVRLWNNEWVKDEYKENFPQNMICSDKERDKITPVIDIDEVSLFDVY